MKNNQLPRWLIVIVSIVVLFCIVVTIVIVSAGTITDSGILEREEEAVRVSQVMEQNPKSLQSEELSVSTEDYEVLCDDAATEIVQSAKEFSTSYCIPSSDRVLLDYNTLLRDYSYGQLYFAYYEIYARYGVTFSEEILDAYFGAKEWYHASMSAEEFEKDDSIVMNDYEILNKNMIYRAFCRLYEEETEDGEELVE